MGESVLIAALIATVSLLALLPLWVSYCGTVLSSVRNFAPSDRVTSLVGTGGRDIVAEDFERILQFVRLCPQAGGDRSVRAVASYYRFLGGFGSALGKFSPGLAVWVSSERVNCAHFAAVTLDRYISSSRNLLSEHAGEDLT